MRLLTSFFTILSLVTPVLAVDPTSIPILVKQWDTECSTETKVDQGLVMLRSNHHCYTLPDTAAGNTDDFKRYGSNFDVKTGNFTIWQYNIPKANASIGLCNGTFADEQKLVKSFTNITARTCVKGLGYSFDWAPVERYIGSFIYTTNNQPDPSTCSDDDEYEQATRNGNVVQIGTCVSNSLLLGGQKKYVDWGNGTVSTCVIDSSDSSACSSNTTCGTGTTPGVYPYNKCVAEVGGGDYLYWVTFGGPNYIPTPVPVPSTPVPTTQTPTTPVPTTQTPTTPAPTTKAPNNNATAAPNATKAPNTPAPTTTPTPPAKPTLKPSSASCTSSTSILTIMVTMAMALVARI